jgi:hypothetical protein
LSHWRESPSPPNRRQHLGIELPLKGFFWLGPALFLVVHAYVLLHFVLLSSKVGMFDAQLLAQIPDDPELRTRLRQQLPINIFVQFLAGPRPAPDPRSAWRKIPVPTDSSAEPVSPSPQPSKTSNPHRPSPQPRGFVHGRFSYA